MILATLFLALSGSAYAGPVGHELQITNTINTSEDPRWGMVGGGIIRLVGVRGGWHLAPGTTVTAGWHSGSRSSSLYSDAISPSAEDEDTYIEEESSPRLELGLHQVSAGAKYSWAARHWLQPYGAAELNLSIGTLSMDDDPDSSGNANELSHTALAPGSTMTLGIDLLPLAKDGRLRPSVFVEAGYHLSMALGFDGDATGSEPEVGQLPISGMVSRVGLGMRF